MMSGTHVPPVDPPVPIRSNTNDPYLTLVPSRGPRSAAIMMRGESISLARRAAATAKKRREEARAELERQGVREGVDAALEGIVGASASTRANVSQNKAKRQKRVKWTAEEVHALRAGVARYGEGRWAVILREFAASFNPVRISVDLKDKWRNLYKVIKPEPDSQPPPTHVESAHVPPAHVRVPHITPPATQHPNPPPGSDGAAAAEPAAVATRDAADDIARGAAMMARGAEEMARVAHLGRHSLPPADPVAHHPSHHSHSHPPANHVSPTDHHHPPIHVEHDALRSDDHPIHVEPHQLHSEQHPFRPDDQSLQPDEQPMHVEDASFRDRHPAMHDDHAADHPHEPPLPTPIPDPNHQNAVQHHLQPPHPVTSEQEHPHVHHHLQTTRDVNEADQPFHHDEHVRNSDSYEHSLPPDHDNPQQGEQQHNQELQTQEQQLVHQQHDHQHTHPHEHAQLEQEDYDQDQQANHLSHDADHEADPNAVQQQLYENQHRAVYEVGHDNQQETYHGEEHHTGMRVEQPQQPGADHHLSHDGEREVHDSELPAHTANGQEPPEKENNNNNSDENNNDNINYIHEIQYQVAETDADIHQAQADHDGINQDDVTSIQPVHNAVNSDFGIAAREAPLSASAPVEGDRNGLDYQQRSENQAQSTMEETGDAHLMHDEAHGASLEQAGDQSAGLDHDKVNEEEPPSSEMRNPAQAAGDVEDAQATAFVENDGQEEYVYADERSAEHQDTQSGAAEGLHDPDFGTGNDVEGYAEEVDRDERGGLAETEAEHKDGRSLDAAPDRGAQEQVENSGAHGARGMTVDTGGEVELDEGDFTRDAERVDDGKTQESNRMEDMGNVVEGEAEMRSSLLEMDEMSERAGVEMEEGAMNRESYGEDAGTNGSFAGAEESEFGGTRKRVRLGMPQGQDDDAALREGEAVGGESGIERCGGTDVGRGVKGLGDDGHENEKDGDEETGLGRNGMRIEDANDDGVEKQRHGELRDEEAAADGLKT